jgi:hypothetical protein
MRVLELPCVSGLQALRLLRLLNADAVVHVGGGLGGLLQAVGVGRRSGLSICRFCGVAGHPRCGQTDRHAGVQTQAMQLGSHVGCETGTHTVDSGSRATPSVGTPKLLTLGVFLAIALLSAGLWPGGRRTDTTSKLPVLKLVSLT